MDDKKATTMDEQKEMSMDEQKEMSMNEKKEIVARYEKAVTQKGDDLADICTDDCTFTIPMNSSMPMNCTEYASLLKKLTGAFPDYAIKTTVIEEADGSLAVAVQNRMGKMKNDLCPLENRRPLVVAADLPDTAKDSDCIMPFAVVHFSFSSSGLISKVEWRGEVGDTADATTMELVPPLGEQCLYKWMGVELKDDLKDTPRCEFSRHAKMPFEKFQCFMNEDMSHKRYGWKKTTDKPDSETNGGWTLSTWQRPGPDKGGPKTIRFDMSFEGITETEPILEYFTKSIKEIGQQIEEVEKVSDTEFIQQVNVTMPAPWGNRDNIQHVIITDLDDGDRYFTLDTVLRDDIKSKKGSDIRCYQDIRCYLRKDEGKPDLWHLTVVKNTDMKGWMPNWASNSLIAGEGEKMAKTMYSNCLLAATKDQETVESKDEDAADAA